MKIKKTIIFVLISCISFILVACIQGRTKQLVVITPDKEFSVSMLSDFNDGKIGKWSITYKGVCYDLIPAKEFEVIQQEVSSVLEKTSFQGYRVTSPTNISKTVVNYAMYSEHTFDFRVVADNIEWGVGQEDVSCGLRLFDDGSVCYLAIEYYQDCLEQIDRQVEIYYAESTDAIKRLSAIAEKYSEKYPWPEN